ncbi:MAG: hypothetical protein NWE95_13640 [Candidatus Bathyarchaeota archaeon]|nr:hypothetical protein [Candidatus Bathyarchaeota archaeon]
MVTVELTSPYYGVTNLAVNRKNLKNAAFAVSAAFLVTIAVRVISILTS